jgi:hypothetical protein
MKAILIFVALIFLVNMSNAQQVLTEKLYRVALVINETDTVPGNENGGIGAGGTGWLYVGPYDVEYSLTSQDSMNATILFDYADTGYISAAGSSAKLVGLQAAARTVNEDSLVALADVANPAGMVSNILRNRLGGVDKIEGGRYLRARILGVNVGSKLAGSTAGRTVSLRIRTLKVAGN